MGMSLQAQLAMIKRIEDVEARVSALESPTPGNYTPVSHGGTPDPRVDFDGMVLPGETVMVDGQGAPYEAKGPRGNPNIEYRPKHRGFGKWGVTKDGSYMPDLRDLDKESAYSEAERLTRGG
jgi:hypothetical protein